MLKLKAEIPFSQFYNSVCHAEFVLASSLIDSETNDKSKCVWSWRSVRNDTFGTGPLLICRLFFLGVVKVFYGYAKKIVLDERIHVFPEG